MKFLLALVIAATMACGQAVTPGPGGPPVGTPLSQPQLKFAVIDAVGKPVYCDPDFYPIAREGGEQANAISSYPQIKADTQTYAAIVAHEHLPSGDLTDGQKLVVYRAWKVLRFLALTPSGSDYGFQYRTQSSGVYQMVTGTVRVDGVVTVSSHTQSGPPPCPICLAASTLIATPAGAMRVTEVTVGTLVWTQTASGERVAAPVIAAGSMAVPAGHLMVHLVLADGREVLVSPGHKTADGRPVGDLKIGDRLDGAVITKWELLPYSGDRTYDLLPAGSTKTYWANGILLASTLSH